MERQRLYFISPRDMRKNRADCVHIMKICDRFAREGYDVALVTPRVYRPEYPVARNDIFRLYGMPESFRILELPTTLTDQSPNWLSRTQKSLVFGLFFLMEILRGRMSRNAILYCKCYISTFPAIVLRRLGLLKSRMFFEKAEFTPKCVSHRVTARNVDGLVCSNNYVLEKVAIQYDIPRTRLHRMSFPTQHPEIAAHRSRQADASRQALGLPLDQRLVMYAGKIGPKMLEIRYIMDAARLLPNERFAFVGVNDSSRPWMEDYLRNHQIRNVSLIGFQPLTRLYDYVSCADLLVSYYDSFDQLSVTQRSPAKACVYLSFGKPVIMADLPSLREWWTDDQVYFVPPDKPEMLAAMIQHVFEHPEEAGIKAAKCLEFARANTYQTSYREIAQFMNRNRPSGTNVSGASQTKLGASPEQSVRGCRS